LNQEQPFPDEPDSPTCCKAGFQQHEFNIEFKAMIALKNIRSLTDFQRNTRSHLKRLKSTARPEVLNTDGHG
jgi:hypothetical protein